MASRPDFSGTFPFGRRSGRREPRRVDDAAVFVLGVYPSALHVRWNHPDFQVTALAVDEEPWPFWDGIDQNRRVKDWQREVGWKSEWGLASPAGQFNGSSGVSVRDHVLAVLPGALERAWLTDAVPFFFVHRGAGTQGAAMSDRYDPFASTHALPFHNLPGRPSPKDLVDYATEFESERLREELLDSGATLVVTLGNEALAVAARLMRGELPHALAPGATYGQRFNVTVAGRRVEVLPLVHPGQRAAIWRSAHERWRRSAMPPG